MKKKTIILVTLALMLLGVNTNAQMSEKPRVIAMTDGEIEDGAMVLRAKIDMANPNMHFRDPIIYRVLRTAHHHRTGVKWKVYPMYDFAHGQSDFFEGVTHSLCTLEFVVHRPLYDLFIDWLKEGKDLNDHRPRQTEFNKLNLSYTLMSKRNLLTLVKEGLVNGWDDPRMPTISGLRRRGYTAASIREFCQRIGVTKQDNNVEMAALESCIRDDLNEIAPRAMAVLDPVKVVIENMPADSVEMIAMPNHPNKPEMGKREVPFSSEIYIDRADFREEANKQYKRLVLGKEVRLRNAYVIKAERVEKDAEGEITTIYCTYDPDTLSKDPADGRKVKGVIHWVSASHAVPAEFHLYDRLFSVANPGAAEDFLSTINPESLVIRSGFVEPSLGEATSDVTYQFEREGYFCADCRYSKPDHLVFNRTVGLRDTWAKAGV